MNKIFILLILAFPAFAQEKVESVVEDLIEATAEELTGNQDNLSANVQELVELQTVPEVIQKLEEVETSMIKATLNLLDEDTGATTIAIQTDIIEKAYEAAEARNKAKSEGESDTDKAMMDQLREMLGKGEEPQEARKGEAEGGQGEGQKGGQGEAASEAEPSIFEPRKRTVPTASGYVGELLPEEFSEFLDSYNDKE